MRQLPTFLLMNECSNMGCRKRPVVAERLSDFWVTKCEDCRKLPSINLDIERIAAVYSKLKTRRVRPAA
jgi:hypothetical protein